MTTTDTGQLRRELLLAQAIGCQMDTLVGYANDAAYILKDYPKMESSQLRNLVNVAQESRSVEVTINFIRYQIGRKSDEWGKGSNGFGHHVITFLQDSLQTLVNDVIAKLPQEIGANPTDSGLRNEVIAQMMRLYLGFLVRAFTFAKKTNGFDQLKAMTKKEGGRP